MTLPFVAKAPIDLAIQGMSCAACAGRVERALRAVPGVRHAAVNLATERARVTGGDTHALIDAVGRAGYAAHPAGQPGLPSSSGFMGAAGAGLLAAPLLVGMLDDRLMLPAVWQCALTSAVLFGFGATFFRGAWRGLRSGSLSMDVLVSLGASAAWALSTYIWWRAPAGVMHHSYYESAAVIVALVRLGKALELRARRSSAAALHSLLKLRPDTIRLLRGGIEVVAPLAQARVGDRAVFRPGERIGLDGRVVAGAGMVDEALLTGESLPVTKTVGENVAAGTMNIDGALTVQVTAIGDETMLARIVRLVETAQADKPHIQQLVDRVSSVFVPMVLVVSVLTFALWWALAGHPEHALLNAVSVLVIACPCALGLATPMAIMIGLGAAARGGILIRDPDVLESAHKLHTVVFDKTGTLTLGKVALAEVTALADIAPAELRLLAGSVLANSEHPLAEAVRVAKPLPAEAFHAYPGAGAGATVSGKTLVFGNRALLAQFHFVPPPGDAGTVSWLAQPGAPGLLGAFRFSDRIRPESALAVTRLLRAGFSLAVLSGDSVAATRAVGAEVGIADARGGLLPSDKAAAIVAMRAQGPVAMVGDGLNDAPALAAADIGIAMGSGTDVAIETAGITLMRSDPRLVADAIDIARRTRRVIWEGLFWAFAYNAIALPLAAAGELTPTIAAAAMAASSLCVVFNALRLRAWKPRS
jgi:Cu+-exporting ATPase